MNVAQRALKALSRPSVRERRAQVVAWFSWLAVTWLVFSFMSGTFHQYYTVALTPAIAALVGIGVGMAKENARKAWVLFTLAGTTVVTTTWGAFLLSTATNWFPWLKWAVVALGALGAIGLTVAGSLRYGKDEADPGTKRGRLLTRAAATLAIVASLWPVGRRGTAFGVVGAVQGLGRRDVRPTGRATDAGDELAQRRLEGVPDGGGVARPERVEFRERLA